MPQLEDKKRDVKYLSKDFDDFRRNLIDYSKIYFPNTYNDFNESSPGMMFIEMASYVGDVLSYYIDKQFKETLLPFAQERKNVMNLAQSLGYKPKVTVPASTRLDVFQTVPALTEDGGVTYKPDMRYALKIREGMRVKSKTTNTTFRVLENVDFSFSSSLDKMDVTVYEYSENIPTFYLLKKAVSCVAGNILEETHTVGSPQKYRTINLTRNDITEIISVYDSDGNRWYEVPYLAQDTIYIEQANNAINDPELAQYSDTTPYLLKLKKVPRRFKTNIISSNVTQLQFGAGISDSPDEEIIPNPTSVGSTLANSPSYLDTAFDPINFLNTKTYGQVPRDTTLTVTYAHGGGVESNVPQDDLVELDFIQFDNDITAVPDRTLLASTKLSAAATNPKPATGGKSGDTLDEIRANALSNFSTQNRAVTKEDYITRVYSLPAKYGNVAKVYIEQDQQLSINDTIDGTTTLATIPNPFGLNLYLLGYDSNKKLTHLADSVKENIRVYLSQYRMLTDSINLLSGYIVNISLDYEIVVINSYNKNEVLLRTIERLREYFNIDRWQFNQPIIKGDIMYQLSLIEGVQNVTSLKFKNETGENYSSNYYNLSEAEPLDTNGIPAGILYPSLDPMIWEIKYPNLDIRGRVR